jgi:hypothetical protein
MGGGGGDGAAVVVTLLRTPSPSDGLVKAHGGAGPRSPPLQ